MVTEANEQRMGKTGYGGDLPRHDLRSSGFTVSFWSPFKYNPMKVHPSGFVSKQGTRQVFFWFIFKAGEKQKGCPTNGTNPLRDEGDAWMIG